MLVKCKSHIKAARPSSSPYSSQGMLSYFFVLRLTYMIWYAFIKHFMNIARLCELHQLPKENLRSTSCFQDLYSWSTYQFFFHLSLSKERLTYDFWYAGCWTLGHDQIMQKVFALLLLELRKLRASIVFADFSRIIIATGKYNMAAAQGYCEYLLKTLKSR